MTQSVFDLASQAKQASVSLGVTSGESRDAALRTMAQALRLEAPRIIAANAIDMEAARKAQTPRSLLDRLMLDEARVEGMATALESLAELPDPLSGVFEQRDLDSGVHLSRVPVPLGVVAMVYEARPNVTADAAGICIKTGNACVLRGGSLAFESNSTIADILHAAAVKAGMPQNCIVHIPVRDRSATDDLLRARGLVDLLIPRGGAGLINHCVENAIVPVIETGVGNCHVYTHAPADLSMARDIIVNAKCSRPGVCNACESLLVDASIAEAFVAEVFSALAERDVVIHADETLAQAAAAVGVETVAATEEDWGREYLELEISAKVVSGIQEAIEHINRYGTKHSECIVTDDEQAAQLFLRSIDAAAVYHNASTRFSDGGEFGLGAEIGISTQKIHARGPFALKALTSYKYLLEGEGQTR